MSCSMQSEPDIWSCVVQVLCEGRLGLWVRVLDIGFTVLNGAGAVLTVDNIPYDVQMKIFEIGL